jgi:RimJ/RimL family protein N-acetyltransferase
MITINLLPKIRVARAVEDELDEIQALDRATLPEAPPNEDTEWWGAWDGHELVGYAGARILPATGAYFLSRAGVVETYRGRGLQKRLIRARVSRARQLLTPRAVTYTVPDNAPSANSLIACGFRVYAPASAFAGAGVVYWRRKL